MSESSIQKTQKDLSILWRSWAAFTVIIAIVLIVMAAISILQHNAILAHMIESRLSVIAHTTSTPFRSITNLGLPISMMRNSDAVLDRARQLDTNIKDIQVFNPTGIIVHSLNKDGKNKVSDTIISAMALSEHNHWKAETETELYSGFNITNSESDPVGAIVVVYPKERYSEITTAVAKRIFLVAFILLFILSLAALLILRVRLNGAINGLARVNDLLQILKKRKKISGQTSITPVESHDVNYGFFSTAIDELQIKLELADKKYHHAVSDLTELAGSKPIQENKIDQRPATFAVSIPETSLARVFTRQLTPWVAGLVFCAVVILGYFSYTEINHSFEPELSARTKLIGTVANNNIQRAVSSGVPLENLVGAENYFNELLASFPEISYFGVSTGRIIIEAGNRQKTPFAPESSRKDVPTFPIFSDNGQIGYIIVDTDPAYFALLFRDVLLDLGVVLIVVVLLAFEVIIVMFSFSLTAPLNRIQHLADRQALGDFSNCILVRGRTALDQLGQFLSERAVYLHTLFASASDELADRQNMDKINKIEKKFRLCRWQPRTLQFSYLNDIRLPLFLFAAADELPISFLPIYTRSVDNPLVWLDQGILLSLPLAGYLLAIVLVSPAARPLAEKFGHRKLLLMAVIPTFLAHLGLYAATNTIEIIVYRTLVGMGYAVATLVCQDYVLDVVPREKRNQSLGFFTAAMFGGLLAGTAMGGILADRLGYSMVFGISAVLVAISGILAFKLIPARAGSASNVSLNLKSVFPPIWQPLKNIRFSLLVFGIAVPANVLLQAFISYLVALQLHAIGSSAADIARVLMTYFLAIALIGPIAPRLFGRYLNPAQVGLIGSFVSGIALCVTALWPSYFSMLVAVAFAGIGHGLVRGPQVAVAMEIAETELRHIGSNAVLGSLRAIERGGSILGLIGLALLSSYAGYAFTIGVVGVWVLLGALIFTSCLYTKRDTDRPSADI